MSTRPLFSIITITYNAGHTVGRTMASIDSQTCRDFEHLIIDGASSDDTLDIIAHSPGAGQRRLVSEPDKGLYDAMNKGVRMARGEYLIFLNAGDKFHAADTLGIIADCITRGNHPGIVYGQTDLVDDEGRYLDPRHLTAPAQLAFCDFARGMLVCHQAFVVRRDIAPEYNLQWRYSADYEWCLRCLRNSSANVYTGATLIDYLYEGLTTANRKRSLIERYKIMCKYYGYASTTLRHIGFAFRFLKTEKH